jgi:hypothetical protein
MPVPTGRSGIGTILSRRDFAAGIVSLMGLGSFSSPAVPSPRVYTPSIQPFNIGAGGFITGGSIANDDTLVVRADAFGAYYWNGSQWIQLVRYPNFPTGTVGFNRAGTKGPYDPVGGYKLGGGVYEIAVAPGDGNRAYLFFSGCVWRTDDLKSAPNHKWIKTAFTQITALDIDPNDQGSPGRVGGPKMSVDPANPDIVYVGAGAHGLFVSRNAGSTWSIVSTVPLPSINSLYVAFDPSSSLSGIPSKTQGIYAFSAGNGVYHSTDASTFSLLSGSPTSLWQIFIDASGILWAGDATKANTLWKFNGSSWTSYNPRSGGNFHVASVAQDPSGNIYCIDESGLLSWSTNKTTFTSATATTRTASDIPWLANTNESFMTAGKIMIDSMGKLIFCEGIGVWTTSSPQARITAYQSQNAGIEELVPNQICVPQGGNPIFSAWDRPVFRGLIKPNSYPSKHGVNYLKSIQHGASCDYASSSNNVIIVGGSDTSGYSLDYGQTWKPFADQSISAAGGGCVGAASPTNFIYVNSQNGDPYYTLDGGQTWHLIVIPGISHGGRVLGATNNGSGLIRLQVDSTSGWSTGNTQTFYNCNGLVDNKLSGAITFHPYTITVVDETHIDLQDSSYGGALVSTGIAQSPNAAQNGWHDTFYKDHRMVVADRGLSNTFYMYNYKSGTYKTADGGQTWAHVSKKAIPFPGIIRLRQVFGKPGHMALSGGAIYASNTGGAKLYRTLNGLSTDWTIVPNVTGVSAIGFGAEAQGASYPTCYIAGWVNRGSSYVYGIWYSTNFDQPTPTWDFITDYPNGNFDVVKDLDGDPNYFGVFYIAFSGSGWSWGHAGDFN